MFKVLVSILLFVSYINPIIANPFAGKQYYVNPSFQSNIDRSITATTDPVIIGNLRVARNAPSAYWLDVMSKVNPSDMGLDTMNGIMADATKKNQLPMFIIYDLPNRDCAAKASNGEICCTKNSDGTCNYTASGNCDAGLVVYKSYINKIITILKKYPSAPVILIIEPDSLPNLVTNMDVAGCSNQATQTSYKEGIKYAVDEISRQAPNAVMYLDAGHGGWLGWENNLSIFQKLINDMNIFGKIRGFATNVANYQPLGIACPEPKFCLPSTSNSGHKCCPDPCGLSSQWNPAQNELNYAIELQSAFPGKYTIIDTGRNGVPNARQNCANWCNPAKTGLGVLPTTKTALAIVDAYFWLKTPGESDGCTQTLPDGKQCPRFDSSCASSDSMKNAPEAGHWFMSQIHMLAKNANFGKVESNWSCMKCEFIK